MNEKQTERELGFSISLSFSGALKMTLVATSACILHRRLHTFIYSTVSAGGGLRLEHIEVESKPLQSWSPFEESKLRNGSVNCVSFSDTFHAECASGFLLLFPEFVCTCDGYRRLDYLCKITSEEIPFSLFSKKEKEAKLIQFPSFIF